MVMTVNKSEERIQCKAATARKLGSPLPLVEISGGAVGGVWRAKRDQPIDGYFRTSYVRLFVSGSQEFLPLVGVQMPILKSLHFDLNFIHGN